MGESPIVELQGIVKTFPGVVANAGIDLTIHPGEVLALLGENGAGKSTLMNVLAGLYRPDAGTIRIDGEQREWHSPRDAIGAGVGMVHQHFRLVEAFSVAENVLLGWQHPRFALNPRATAAIVGELAGRHGLALDPTAHVSHLALGERQRVEILKLLSRDARVLILDEPTAVLAPHEIEQLFGAIRRIAAGGRSVVFISHKLDEVVAIADRIVVLRGGRVAGMTTPRAASPRDLARMMVGHEIEPTHRGAGAPGEVALAVDALTVAGGRGPLAVLDATLRIRLGEIVGIAGVAGNGQRELVEAIAGLRPAVAGRITLLGKEITRLDPRSRWTRGIAYIPEDRAGEGLIGAHSVTENAVLRDYHRPPIARGLFLHWPAARRRAEAIVRAFGVRAAGLQARVRHLSGGNQQRLLVGREVSGRPRVLLAAQPTRGLDIDATAAVQQILLDLRAAGTAVLLVSENLDELLELGDRLVVMHRGRIVGELAAGAATREELGLLMAGAAVA